MNNLAAIINEQGLLPLTTIIKISISFILGGIIGLERESKGKPGNDSNLLIVFYVQIMPDDFVMQLHR
ncbi:hypothetical protein ABN281_24530, partial [Escherichia coli]